MGGLIILDDAHGFSLLKKGQKFGLIAFAHENLCVKMVFLPARLIHSGVFQQPGFVSDVTVELIPLPFVRQGQ